MIMDIEAFLLCKCATDERGKLNVLGAFDTVTANKLPIVLPAVSVALRIRFSSIEEGTHQARIKVIDEDGKDAGADVTAKANVRMQQDRDSSVSNLILYLQRFKLEKFGRYRIDLAIDGHQEATLPLFVKQIQSKTETQED
jgi:hypothetical protein